VLLKRSQPDQNTIKEVITDRTAIKILVLFVDVFQEVRFVFIPEFDRFTIEHPQVADSFATPIKHIGQPGGFYYCLEYLRVA